VSGPTLTEGERPLAAGEGRQVARRAARMLRPYRATGLLAMAVMLVWTGTTLAGPYLVRYGIDRGIRRDDAGALDLAIVAYVGVAVVAYAAYRWQVLLVNRVGEGFLRDLRLRLFDHLQRLSQPFYDREKAGVIVSRMTSDIDALSELVQQGLLMFTTNALLLVVSVAVLAAVSWELLLLCCAAVPFLVVASVKFQRDSNRAYLAVRDRVGSTLSTLQEGIAGVRVIQAFAREDVEVGRFAERNRGLYDAHMESVRVSTWYMPLVEFAGLFTTAAAVGTGGWLVRRGDVSIGDVAFFVLTLNNLFEPIQQLSQLFNTVQSAGAGLKKVFEVLDTPLDVDERPGAVDLPAQGVVVVEHVGFAYAGGEPVLRDVSLTLAPGERLALVGPTGAGKSTLAKLVARLYDPTAGRITYAGVDLRDARLGSLRRRVVVVPQEGFLFHGTILENIRMARAEATDAEVERALADIGVLERFAELPEGLRTEVHERGSRLSAGEKQLVSLARAALVDPAVLVLDEATSSLDPGTEQLVEAALERLTEGRTVVAIAHRLTTAERADRVAVVDAGGLAEVGTHDELLAVGGRYAALFATWTGGLAPTG
jgi:ATP-binding cassette subfamily B protein